MKDAGQTPFRIGVVGCGNISATYLRNAALFRDLEITRCADLNADAARARSEEFGVAACSVDDLLAAPDIDLVLNLTVPNAHYALSRRALEAGKHVFVEKPLSARASEARELLRIAGERGLQVGSAPDTFLGAAGRIARELVDTGAIGQPVLGTAFMFGRGMEHWHPNPAFYYQPGAGPVLDMGPYYVTALVNLLGPVRAVSAATAIGEAERLITAPGPLANTRFAVGTPTTALSLLEFHSGPVVTFCASWDVFRHSNRNIELHGTGGSLRLPDPDNFGDVVAVSTAGADWTGIDSSDTLFGRINFPVAAPDRANYRTLGLAEMIDAIRAGRPPRASGLLALHVLEVLEAILTAGETRSRLEIETRPARPEPFGVSVAEALLA
jgi:predicted dehydrogenase